MDSKNDKQQEQPSQDEQQLCNRIHAQLVGYNRATAILALASEIATLIVAGTNGNPVYSKMMAGTVTARINKSVVLMCSPEFIKEMENQARNGRKTGKQ